MNKTPICRVNWDSLPWITPIPEVRFKAFEQNGQRIRLVEFLRGFKETDWCRNGHIGYVLEGEGELEFSDRTVPLKTGDGIFISPGAEHEHMLHVVGELIRVVLVEEMQFKAQQIVPADIATLGG